MQKYGYIRVSTKEQNPERQYAAMEKYQIDKDNIYVDKMSGKNFDRPAYQEMLAQLQKGDLVIIKSIDRLGRNYNEILEQWRQITKMIGADIEVIDMPLLNTASGNGKDGLTGVFLSDMVLQILAYFAETERNFIRQRQAEGIAVAKAKGVRFGNRRIKEPDEFEYYYREWSDGRISLRKAAEKMGISYSTFYRRCLEQQKKTF